MKVSLSWLREYIPITMETKDLADALTMAGLEIESVDNRYESLDNVVVSRIVEIKEHPNADKLRVCQVDVGDGILSVVCGAPNAAKGLLIPCALEGATLPNGMVIKKGRLRGELSEGMLCSASELGLSLEKSGIMELRTDALPGTPLAQALGLNDATLDISVTPNRPDCLSIIGIAREIGAFEAHKTKVTYPDPNLASPSKDYKSISEYTSVQIKDPDLCPRYAARLVFDVTVGPSPFWLQDRLISVGMKPINNIVDVTNFVMMETGQPLHAFDFDRLGENRIVVRAASPGEVFTTLDDREHTLDSEMLMICDGEKPVALAGVMGGLNSEIYEKTTRVLIESAYFDPACIRKTSKKTALSTDAAYRFERGIDPGGVLFALNRAASLITSIGNGTLVDGQIDEYPKPIPSREITVNIQALNKRLGTSLTMEDIKGYLESIEMTVQPLSEGVLSIHVPTFRVDLERPEDISEEVARLWGYNRIKTTFPPIPAEAFELTPNLRVKNLVRSVLTGYGFSETIHYSFIHSRSCDALRLSAHDPRRNVIDVLNPISEDQSVMRTSLVPGILSTIHYNNARQVKNLMIFEIGKVFLKKEDSVLPDEVEMIVGAITGNSQEPSWYSKEIECDFFDLKGLLDGFFKGLHTPVVDFSALTEAECTYTRKGYSARMSAGNEPVGLLGKVHQDVLDAYDIRQDVFIFEIALAPLVNLARDEREAGPIPRYPSVSRDTTIICGNDVRSGALLSCLRKSGEDLVEKAELLDLYTGDPIPKGKKSLSFRMTYRSQSKTLKDKDVNKIHTKITQMLLDHFNADLPG
ncbi:MAG: phenylalanine--tRNA ligase subunit beta [Proteobacteria bacterium]|nr:phenylalanine--tRNA ligase subunit beta [Pseudomonadota bacterium]